jgi:hypothetical protein
MQRKRQRVLSEHKAAVGPRTAVASPGARWGPAGTLRAPSVTSAEFGPDLEAPGDPDSLWLQVSAHVDAYADAREASAVSAVGVSPICGFPRGVPTVLRVVWKVRLVVTLVSLLVRR